MPEGDPDLAELVGELAGAVDELQSELAESRGPPRPPTPRRLARFTSEVTIPAIILVLETNVRALRLLQRTLRIAEGQGGDATTARDRASSLGQRTLTRLDGALSDLQDAVAQDPPDEEVGDLLQRIEDLQAEVDARLDATDATSDGPNEPVGVDVEEELRTLKDDVDDDADDGTKDND